MEGQRGNSSVGIEIGQILLIILSKNVGRVPAVMDEKKERGVKKKWYKTCYVIMLLLIERKRSHSVVGLLGCRKPERKGRID